MQPDQNIDVIVQLDDSTNFISSQMTISNVKENVIFSQVLTSNVSAIQVVTSKLYTGNIGYDGGYQRLIRTSKLFSSQIISLKRI